MCLRGLWTPLELELQERSKLAKRRRSGKPPSSNFHSHAHPSTMNLRTETDKLTITKGTPKVFVDKKCLSGEC